MKNAFSPFVHRHIGLNDADRGTILSMLGYSSMEDFIRGVVPKDILYENLQDFELPLFSGGLSEEEALALLKKRASRNQVATNYIGQGYYPSHTPAVILRNVMENPAWYTAYTPYQPEISQGRLEALLNFQTMVMELTAMDIANASMLDEGSAAAEAMTLSMRVSSKKTNVYLVSDKLFPQTIEVLKTRAEPLDIQIQVVNVGAIGDSDWANAFGLMVQYPDAMGNVPDHRDLVRLAKQHQCLVAVATDLLALTQLVPPGEWGADICFGNSQRFGVPLGFGGPHAAFFATTDALKRHMPGRLVGVSKDAQGQPALRLALQTREQHIRREKATSNICTAQALLAIMASMYAVYHGPDGLDVIAKRIHAFTDQLAQQLTTAGFSLVNESFFDTVFVQVSPEQRATILARANAALVNLNTAYSDRLGVALDETVQVDDLLELLYIFTGVKASADAFVAVEEWKFQARWPQSLQRTSAYLTHQVFHQYRSEHDLLRYLRRLSDKDLALDRTMIPLGSCTMKLNATSEMLPVSWPEFANIHPFAPASQTAGYLQMIQELERLLAAVTGYDECSIQPNAGSQGEYAGLLMIRKYQQDIGQGHRDICLIPSSAHGTNPATAHLAGMQIVLVACDEAGNVDLIDLQKKISQYSNKIAAMMITYPSTHGVFEVDIRKACAMVHDAGGQVYIDGANMNAMVGLCGPGRFGGDVSHLNLHKTFCIPHGGGGPGVGPVVVRAHLAPYLPGREKSIGLMTAAPYGSAMILPISWMYIVMMGAKGLQFASQNAILAANYIAHRLKSAYPILYTGANQHVAHECILDTRAMVKAAGLTVDDIAKRLIDYGFHAPTMSFPVAGTLMIEPTESEPLVELDRFIDAMLQIAKEIAAVAEGRYTATDNPLANAPHTAEVMCADEWHYAYSRTEAAYPVKSPAKYWPPVGRIDHVYGDRNLFCSCI